ncbi:MAG: FHA domain-containing protein [Spirulina sp. DLM2.Bin59]|nr:MAG: FHA domain-containing protein [Spirulina sp. DLM2.Bin59]
MEFENRLNLYQVFQTLYDHHPDLLNDILKLEDAQDFAAPLIPRHPYILGMVETETVYLITNLLDSRTQAITQPQWIWTIGRAGHNAITLGDHHLSRHHAAIQYIPGQGFFVHDLNSTNGTYLNQEVLHAPRRLYEGDHLRIGSVVISFFICQQTVASRAIAIDLATYLRESSPLVTPEPPATPTPQLSPEQQQSVQSRTTSAFLPNSQDSGPQVTQTPPSHGPLNHEQQSEILDRFFQIHNEDMS